MFSNSHLFPTIIYITLCVILIHSPELSLAKARNLRREQQQPFDAPGEVACSENTDCGSCLEDSCFWCRSKQKCSHGVDLECGTKCDVGPGAMCFNVTQCSSAKTCSACTNTDGCSWCDATQTCSDSCISTVEDCPGCLRKIPSECPAHECSTLTKCSDCTAAEGCGWCAEMGKCMPSVTNGTAPCGGNCKYWSYHDCSIACRYHSSCGDCVKSETDCVWCAGEIAGDRENRESQCIWSGEKKINCSVRFELPTRPCPQCHAVSNCSTCLRSGAGHCGWCERRNGHSDCVEGDKMGPYSYADCNPSSGFWAKECRPWNNTVPLPPPVKAPQAVPAAPPQATQPPTTVPPPPPVKPPMKPPKPPVAPVPTPAAHPPTYQPSAPATAPSQDLAPDSNNNINGGSNNIFYSPVFDVLIGLGIGAVISIVSGVIWWRCNARRRYRYRAIGRAVLVRKRDLRLRAELRRAGSDLDTDSLMESAQNSMW